MTKSDSEKDSKFWDDTRDNISEGARKVGEEARELGSKISSYSEVIFGKIKDRSEDLFKKGKELTKDAVNKAQEEAEKLRDKLEISKLNEEKKKIAAQLGMQYYLALKNNENNLPPDFHSGKEIASLLKEMEDLDEEILKVSEDN